MRVKNHQAQQISRRGFLGAGSVAATLLAAGRLPLLGAQSPRRKALPYAVRDIAGVLRQFEPAENGSGLPETCTLAYAGFAWRGRNVQTGMTQHGSAGTLSIRKKPAGDAAVFSVERTMTVGARNIITAEMNCGAGKIPALRSWTLSATQEPVDPTLSSLVRYDERGSVRKGNVQLTRGKAVTEWPAELPVLSQWQVPALVSGLAAGGKEANFDLLQDLSLFKPGQTLMDDGTIQVPVKGGKSIKLRSYVILGHGILPTHYLVDERGLPHLVIAGLLSWALRSVS